MTGCFFDKKRFFNFVPQSGQIIEYEKEGIIISELKLKKGYYFFNKNMLLSNYTGELTMYTGILLYPRFSEYELSVLLSVLKQGQKQTVYIGLNQQVVKGEAGLPSIPEVTILSN